MSISVLGAGAFGTSLALALSKDGQPVTLWSRDEKVATVMEDTRKSGPRLQNHSLPDSLTVTSDANAFSAQICLIAVPTQQLALFLNSLPDQRKKLVACCKGIDRKTGLGPVATIEALHPDATAGLLTGPSFAADIALGLPTALVLACRDESIAIQMQNQLSRPALRIYRTEDIIGAELGGALKNVVALAAGMAIGAGLGDSARASVIARGFAEIQRFATMKGAAPETLNGLSGLGDLVLTCTSEKSRNFTAGLSLGKGDTLDPTVTIEGIATAPAVRDEARTMGLDLPLIKAVSQVAEGNLDIAGAIETLLARPAGKE